MFIADILSSILGWGSAKPTRIESESNGAEGNTSRASDYACFTENGDISLRYINDIREVLCDFLRKMSITYPEVTYNTEFAQACCDVALHEGLQPEIVQSPEFQLALHGAVAIATNTYGHLENVSTQHWICLYTIGLIYFDDLTKTDSASVQEFHTRFISAQPQIHPLLEYWAGLLRNSPRHFLPTCANLVVSSSLDFITGLIVDHDQQSLPVNKFATSYPRWFRTMMGVSTAFVIFTFPPDVPLEVYVQIVPNMVNYIDDVNDLFSFYKEEAAHENTNHISLLAKLTGKSKLDCMRYLAEYSIDGSRRCEEVVSKNPKALEIYRKHFLPGYVAFHAAASRRYKLDDLQLV